MTALIAATAFASGPAPVPDEIAIGLSGSGIEVVDASAVDVGSLSVRSKLARRVALKHFRGFAHPYTSGWTRVGRVTVDLARVIRSNSTGRLGLFPDQLVWIVVIRDVTVPLFGPPGRSGPLWYIGTMAVFVRTDVPRYIVATTF